VERGPDCVTDGENPFFRGGREIVKFWFSDNLGERLLQVAQSPLIESGLSVSQMHAISTQSYHCNGL
jgi:hypothetical protein